MRFTVSVLGTELLSIELVRTDAVDDTDGEEIEAGGGGQFELGFRPPRPTWSVLPGEDGATS